jgi:hypothetical protein
MVKPHITKQTIEKAKREAHSMGEKYAGITQCGKTVKIYTDNNKGNLTAFLRRHAKVKEKEYATKLVTVSKRKR